MPRIVCTGYELTDALRKYMKVGHGIDIDQEVSISSEDNADADDDEEYKSDNDDDEEALAAQREAWNVRMYQQYFGQVRGEAPVEVRKSLEIPYSELSENSSGHELTWLCPFRCAV